VLRNKVKIRAFLRLQPQTEKKPVDVCEKNDFEIHRDEQAQAVSVNGSTFFFESFEQSSFPKNQ